MGLDVNYRRVLVETLVAGVGRAGQFIRQEAGPACKGALTALFEMAGRRPAALFGMAAGPHLSHGGAAPQDGAAQGVAARNDYKDAVRAGMVLVRGEYVPAPVIGKNVLVVLDEQDELYADIVPVPQGRKEFSGSAGPSDAQIRQQALRLQHLARQTP